ncbi:MAG: sigma-70 family RNA polymerase sigma factor [Pirellulales bacterium]|nr:sigma-70 family RNA polymerase sigma factor [Pirellulales bacterium]
MLTAASSTSARRERDDLYVELLTRHKSQLFRFIFALVHSLPDAEDLFQQTAITMWDKFGDFQPGTDFYAWACTIARFKALDFFKVRGRHRLPFSDELIEQIAQRNHWQEESRQAKLQALASCRSKLSKVDQELLATCYGGGGNIRAAAQQIGRPVGSVYDSLSRIRRALYTCIKQTLASDEQA